jgi:HSP20 family protein
MAKEVTMAIIRWTPFSAFTSLEREMQEMMDRLGTRPLIEGFEWRPSTDVYEEEGNLFVRVELPGVDPETELNVEVKDDMLHISGEKKLEREVQDGAHHMKECRYGAYRRDLLLPEGVDPEGVRATYEHGILTVMLPMPQEMKKEPRLIKVEVETPAIAGAPTV